MTAEQINKHVKDAFDSVELIKELNAKENLSQDEIERKARNQEHLAIMLEKDWFLEALTSDQEQQILNVL